MGSEEGRATRCSPPHAWQGRPGSLRLTAPGCRIHELQTLVPGRAQLSGGCGCSLGTCCQLPPPQPQFHVSGGCETFMISLEMGFSSQSPGWKPQAWPSQAPPASVLCLPCCLVPLDIQQLEPCCGWGWGAPVPEEGSGCPHLLGLQQVPPVPLGPGLLMCRMGILQMPVCCGGNWCPEPVLQTPSPLSLPEVPCGPPLSPKTCSLPWALPSRPETG